jgi:hypothetical protein
MFQRWWLCPEVGSDVVGKAKFQSLDIECQNKTLNALQKEEHCGSHPREDIWVADGRGVVISLPSPSGSLSVGWHNSYHPEWRKWKEHSIYFSSTKDWVKTMAR